MTRQETQFDSMLRHLGAAYYQTIHGGAIASDVARALESAEEEDEHDREPAGPPRRYPQSGRWRVSDVMTTDVVTVDKATSYKQVAQIMTAKRVNAVPVLTKERHVAGMVSEADLLLKEERNFRRLGTGLPKRTRKERARAEARSAAELMNSPAITIHPDAPVGAAARLMNGRHIRRLPVVDPTGTLIGIVCRRDLLSVFLRPDEEIAAEVRSILTGILLEQPESAEVKVADGVVILSGTLARDNLIHAAERLASNVDGVVSVICKLTARPTSGTDVPPAHALPAAESDNAGQAVPGQRL
jgi:CBS domain-containing protein